MAPSQLQDDVWVKQIIALVEASRETVKVALLEEPGQKLLGNLSVLRFRRIFHGVLEEAILFAQLDRLLPAVVALVEVGGDAAEFNQLVLLEPLGQDNRVEVVEGVDARLQSVVVFLGDEESVEGLVDRLVVQVLNGAQVRFYQLQVTNLKKKNTKMKTLFVEKKYSNKYGRVSPI